MADEILDDGWRPLGFEGDKAESYGVLVDGVPRWMSGSFWDWIGRQFALLRYNTHGNVTNRTFNTAMLRDAERICRFDVEFTGFDFGAGVSSLRAVVEPNALELRLADYLLSREEEADPSLDAILRESGSAWRVGERFGKWGLVRRVPEGVQLAADETMIRSGHAGVRLAQAWAAAFGVDPDPSKAYSLAIKAVEDAAASLVTPTDRLATLGKISGVVRDQGEWSLPTTREDADFPSGQLLHAMMRALWTGQSDRHGGDPDGHIPMTQDAAEVAVLMAVPLVQWFSSGQVARR